MLMDLYFMKGTTTFVAALPTGQRPGSRDPWPYDCVELVEINENNGDANVLVTPPGGEVTVYSREIFPELDK